MESREQGGEGVGSQGKGGDSGSYFLPCYHLSCIMKGRCLCAEMMIREATVFVEKNN